MNKLWMGLIIVSLVGVSLACSLIGVPDDRAIGEIYTQAASTVRAELTEDAKKVTIIAPTATTQVENFTPTPTIIVPSAATASPTNTAKPKATKPAATQMIIPTATKPPCNWVTFVSDVTVRDKTVFTTGEKFKKTWRLKNNGRCTWGTGYDLVFVDGHAMSSVSRQSLPKKVKPGESIDLSIDFTAPNRAAGFRGNWMLESKNGVRFGIGANADKPFWVEIVVLKPYKNFRYDFSIHYCDAKWKSEKNDDLPCPGERGHQNGFALLLTDPLLENRREDEPTLWTHPNRELGGWISGTYPPFLVKSGDHFRAWIGCLARATGCNVTFKLKYQVGNQTKKILGSWHEVLDGSVKLLDINLSSLAGKRVKFILFVQVAGGKPQNADAFWFLPRIE